jgi:hypothetical protein
MSEKLVNEEDVLQWGRESVMSCIRGNDFVASGDERYSKEPWG